MVKNIGDPTESAVKFPAVTPNDSTDLPGGCTRALWVGGAGNVVVLDEDGTESTITGVPAGTLLPIRVKRVKATSTATNMTAFY